MVNNGFVKCAFATLNTSKLSNPVLTRNEIKKLVQKASLRDVKILIFPELCMTGYSCQDLFHFTQLRESTMKCLKDLVSFSTHFDVLFVVGAPIEVCDVLYNCAIVIHRGKICGVVPKQYLPNSGEFYEKRWFTAYTDFSLTSINLFGENVPFGNLIFSSTAGYKLGIEICEDLWAVIPPSSFLALAGANIIANLSASNELIGKDKCRQELVQSQSFGTISAYIYASAGFGESTSDLVFGGSGYVFENGKKLAEIPRYQMENQLCIVDIDVESLLNERLTNKTF